MSLSRDNTIYDETLLNFDDAFAFVKDLYQNHYLVTLSKREGVSLFANLLCVSRILPDMLPNDSAKAYEVDFPSDLFNQHPWDVEKHQYASVSEAALHEEFDNMRTNIIQSAIRRTPAMAGKCKLDFINKVEHYREARRLELKNPDMYRLFSTININMRAIINRHADDKILLNLPQ